MTNDKNIQLMHIALDSLAANVKALKTEGVLGQVTLVMRRDFKERTVHCHANAMIKIRVGGFSSEVDSVAEYT